MTVFNPSATPLMDFMDRLYLGDDPAHLPSTAQMESLRSKELRMEMTKEL